MSKSLFGDVVKLQKFLTPEAQTRLQEWMRSDEADLSALLKVDRQKLIPLVIAFVSNPDLYAGAILFESDSKGVLNSGALLVDHGIVYYDGKLASLQQAVAEINKENQCDDVRVSYQSRNICRELDFTDKKITQSQSTEESASQAESLFLSSIESSLNSAQRFMAHVLFTADNCESHFWSWAQEIRDNRDLIISDLQMTSGNGGAGINVEYANEQYSFGYDGVVHDSNGEKVAQFNAERLIYKFGVSFDIDMKNKPWQEHIQTIDGNGLSHLDKLVQRTLEHSLCTLCEELEMDVTSSQINQMSAVPQLGR